MTINEQVLEMLKDFSKAYPQVEIPPKAFIEMHPEIISVNLAADQPANLSIRFPFDERFTNPAGMFQGGMMCAAMDNVFGPLSFLVSKAMTTTINFDCKYIRPFMAKDKFMRIDATVVSHTKQILSMQAKAINSAEKLLAIATTQFLILD